MSQKLPVDGFKREKNNCEFNENFIRNYNEMTVIKDTFLK